MANKNYTGRVFTRANNAINGLLKAIDDRRDHPNWYEDEREPELNYTINADGSRTWSF